MTPLDYSLGQVWIGCQSGKILRFSYDGNFLPPLSDHHIAQIKFITPRANPSGVLSGASDGALVYCSTAPIHKAVFGVPPERNRFICNHKIWECAVDVPSTGLMWLGGDSAIAALDPIKQVAVATIPVGTPVRTMCRVGPTGCHEDSIWAAGGCQISVYVLGGSTTPSATVHIGPVESRVTTLAWSGDSEVSILVMTCIEL